MKERLVLLGGLVLGIVLVRVLISVPGWLKERRENRQYIAVNNLTPDRLIARCGTPVADETKDLYPMVARDMRYKGSDGTIVLKFSKTAETSSEWVFMSMQDESGKAQYETPVAQIAALSCLDSRK
jgi:hypothetical protein